MKVVHVKGGKKRLYAQTDEEATLMVTFCEKGGTVTWKLQQDCNATTEPGYGMYFESEGRTITVDDRILELETYAKALQFELDEALANRNPSLEQLIGHMIRK